MNINAIIGNPPYQVSDGGSRASAKPLYHEYVDVASSNSLSYTSMIMPTRWYAGGKGLNEFRDRMLNDTGMIHLEDFMNPSIVFPNMNIRGGVCYFLRGTEFDNEDSVNVVTHQLNGDITQVSRTLKTEGTELFVRDAQSLSIVGKVRNMSEASLAGIISSRKPFGLPTDFVNDDEFHTVKDGLRNPLICYCKGMKHGYVEERFVKIHREWINCWKVFMPYANNIGTELSDDNLNTFLGKPGTITTETYLVVGADLELDKKKAENLMSYLKTRFVRFLHSLAKSGQHATSKTFQFVPLQDFSEPWTDEKLYRKYNLSPEEIGYIESLIKEMK